MLKRMRLFLTKKYCHVQMFGTFERGSLSICGFLNTTIIGLSN